MAHVRSGPAYYFCCICSCYGARPVLGASTPQRARLGNAFVPLLARGPSGPTKHLPFLLYCSCYGARPVLGASAPQGPSYDSPLSHYWRAARAGPLSICLSCFIAPAMTRGLYSERALRRRPRSHFPLCLILALPALPAVCKRAPRVGGRLVILEWSRTPSPRCPRPPKCSCVALQVNCPFFSDLGSSKLSFPRQQLSSWQKSKCNVTDDEYLHAGSMDSKLTTWMKPRLASRSTPSCAHVTAACVREHSTLPRQLSLTNVIVITFRRLSSRKRLQSSRPAETFAFPSEKSVCQALQILSRS